MKKEILFRVNAGGEYGSGHLNRCLVLARELREEFDPYFLAKGDNRLGEILYKENFNFKLAMHSFEEEVRDIAGLRPNLVFLDMKETPAAFVRAVKEYAPVLDLDDGGSGALAANLSVRSLPLPGAHQANLDSPQYLIFDPAIDSHLRAKPAGKIKKVLVSFGGADPAGLTGVMIRIAKLSALPLTWTFVRGQFNRAEWQPGDYLEERRGGDHIFDLIQGADLVITSFGMTAWEAAAIGTPVLLLNPGAYHEQLTALTPWFASMGVYSRGADGDNTPELCEAFMEQLRRPEGFKERAAHALTMVDTKGRERVIGLIRTLLERGKRDACHVCGAREETSLRRDPQKTLYQCGACGLLYTQFLEEPDFSYEASYFEEEYAAQYGKTYMEDRINISRVNKVRIGELERVFKKANKEFSGERSLLEIGSAYGFFLDDVREAGWLVQGVEPSAAAVKHAEKTLRLDVIKGFFPDVPLETERYHAIALWFTLEHFRTLNPVMEKIYSSLKRGGVLALSTPNSRGFTGRFRKDTYLDQHPADHFYDFSVPTLKKLLHRYRFKVVRVRMTGVHYDRVLGDRQGGFWDKPFFAKLYGFAARLFKLGDTFEIYAVKK